MGEKKLKKNEGKQFSDNKNFYELQDDYINWIKKKEKLQKKLTQVEEDNANIMYEDEVDDQYHSVKEKYK